MNTCKHCGNQWTDGRAHCPKCGVRHLAAPQVVAKSATTEKSCGADRPKCIDYDCKHNYFNGQCWRDGGACIRHIRPMTNAERIKSMSNEALLNVLDLGAIICDNNLSLTGRTWEKAVLEWLMQEVE